jgi:hypothetical protein
LKGVVEKVGDEAEGRFGDDIDGLCVGVASRADRFDVGVLDVTAAFGDLVSEPQSRVRLRVGRAPERPAVGERKGPQETRSVP